MCMRVRVEKRAMLHWILSLTWSQSELMPKRSKMLHSGNHFFHDCSHQFDLLANPDRNCRLFWKTISISELNISNYFRQWWAFCWPSAVGSTRHCVVLFVPACFVHSNLFSFILFLTTTSFLIFLFQQPPQHQLDDDPNAAGWVMPHKKCYHPHLCRFMEFLHGFSVELDNRATFTWAELLVIRPSDIKRWLGLAAYGDPDFDISDPVNHMPTCCR